MQERINYTEIAKKNGEYLNLLEKLDGDSLIDEVFLQHDLVAILRHRRDVTDSQMGYQQQRAMWSRRELASRLKPMINRNIEDTI